MYDQDAINKSIWCLILPLARHTIPQTKERLTLGDTNFIKLVKKIKQWHAITFGVFGLLQDTKGCFYYPFEEDFRPLDQFTYHLERCLEFYL